MANLTSYIVKAKYPKMPYQVGELLTEITCYHPDGQPYTMFRCEALGKTTGSQFDLTEQEITDCPAVFEKVE